MYLPRSNPIEHGCNQRALSHMDPEDIYHHLHKAKCITIIDFCMGYWQVPLDEESSYLTTFNTPFGRYHFTHLPFRINVSGDAFQRKLDTIYNPLPNVIGIADDLNIWGNKDDGSDHDEALTKFLQTTKENGLKINIDKLQYKAKEISFFGETYTTNGHRPSAEKIKAIQDMLVPTNVMELQTFLGMCQYLAKCCVTQNSFKRIIGISIRALYIFPLPTHIFTLHGNTGNACFCRAVLTLCFSDQVLVLLCFPGSI